MARVKAVQVAYQIVELDGVRYAILREQVLREIVRRAGTSVAVAEVKSHATADLAELTGLEGDALAKRLAARRRDARLTQAELARRAGIRTETLNRIERGKTTPDFSTVRKLVMAIKQIDAELRQ